MKTFCKAETVADILEKYTYLSEEQKDAVYGLTQNDNFGVLVGKAGAGKTTTMKAIAEIYKKSGARVIGMSLSAVASENLGKDADIESATIASWEYKWGIYERAKEKFLSFNSVVNDGMLKQLDWFKDLKRYERAQLKAGDVIIVDEAGMVGTKEWHTILKHAEMFGVKVIAVGDDNQFKPISSGDCFNQFMRQKNIFHLSEIRRQKEDWQKQVSVEFAKLNTGTALGIYESHGNIHELSDSGKSIAISYVNAESKGSVAVLCSTNKECREINDIVREMKKIKGELGEDIVKIGERNFAKDDKIVFLENNKQFDVKNGLTGVVQSFDNGVLYVQTEEGTKHVKADEYDKIDHAYAITLHKSQGKTYDRTIVLASKFMDAKAMYVAMTRHREGVDLYYRKSDFATFKALVNGVSKYAYKDSLEDYRNVENQNRARVIEYKELQIEKAQLLHDINKGVATWNEYGELKQKSLSLGKEMLRNFDSYKLYLQQQGITKETLEIQCGERQRPLSKVEISARDTVELYAKTAQTARSMFIEMKKENFNVMNNPRYEEYCEIRNLRNDLAKEILSNYPLHREFVNQSKEYFISKRGMEQQVNYESKKTESLLKKLENSCIDTSPHEGNSYRKYLKNSVDFIKTELESNSYRLLMEINKNDSGQVSYVTRDMLKNYLMDNELNISAKNYMCEYASKLIQTKIDNEMVKEVTAEEIVSSIKEAVCLEALREVSRSDTSIEKLQGQARVLSEHLTDKNIRALNDKELLMQFTELSSSQKNVQPLLQKEDIQKELVKESRHAEISM